MARTYCSPSLVAGTMGADHLCLRGMELLCLQSCLTLTRGGQYINYDVPVDNTNSEELPGTVFSHG
jgi:hypothetical protein